MVENTNTQVLDAANIPELMESFCLRKNRKPWEDIEPADRNMIRKEKVMMVIEKHTSTEIREYLENAAKSNSYLSNKIENFFIRIG